MRIKYLLLLGLMFLFTDCQKDSLEIEEKSERLSENVSGETVPDVVNYLDHFFNSANFKLGKINLPFPKKLVDKKTIVKVKNPETGNSTFTFAVKRKKRDNYLFQVVVTKYGKNDFSEPYIFKYVFDDVFREELNKGTANWANYKNSIYPYSLRRAKEDISKNGEDDCPDIPPGGGSTGGGGGSSGGGSTGGGGGPSGGGSTGGGGGPLFDENDVEDCSWFYDETNDILWINCNEFNTRPFTGDEDDCPDGPSDPFGPNNPVIDEAIILAELQARIVHDPFFLVDIPCSEIEKWKDIANSETPESVVDKMDMLNEDYPDIWDNWEIQELEDATGTVTNMDNFAIKIDQLPINGANGSRFQPNDFLDYFRRNINDFTDENSLLGSSFEPYCEIQAICQQETNLWNSSNPVASIIYIDIGAPDDGSVIVSESSDNSWRFKTIRAPWSGTHPVSGTREFGIEQNNDGSYNLYTRGVDRFKSNFIEDSAFVGMLGDSFRGADALWELMQSNLTDFVNANGGDATTLDPVTERPDWEDVKDVLNGIKPIDSLGCK